MLTISLLLALLVQSAPATSESPSRKNTQDRGELLRSSVASLIAMQEPDGDWAYEGVYRVNREIPIGYRVGLHSLSGLRGPTRFERVGALEDQIRRDVARTREVGRAASSLREAPRLAIGTSPAHLS